MLKRFYMWYGILGLFIISVSFILSWTMYTWRFSFIFPGLFMSGYVLLFDAINYRLSGESFIYNFNKYKKFLLHLFLVGCALGVIFEIGGNVFGNLWSYEVPTIFMNTFLIPSWGFLAMMCFESYLAVMNIFKGWKEKKVKLKKRFYDTLGIIGALGIVYFTVRIYMFFGEGNLFWDCVVAGFSVWFIMEYVEYRIHERSLLADIIGGYWKPMIVLLIVTYITAIVWETMNIPVGAWVYTNIPYSNIKLFGLPVLIYVMWPFIYIFYISFFRIFLAKEEKDIKKMF